MVKGKLYAQIRLNIVLVVEYAFRCALHFATLGGRL